MICAYIDRYRDPVRGRADLPRALTEHNMQIAPSSYAHRRRPVGDALRTEAAPSHRGLQTRRVGVPARVAHPVRSAGRYWHRCVSHRCE